MIPLPPSPQRALGYSESRVVRPRRGEAFREGRWVMASRSPISKLVNTEDREQAERELQQLVDAVPQHIVVLSGDGRRLYANQAARDYHSLTLDQFLVEPTVNSFHADDIENYSRMSDSGIASGEPWEAEARLRRKDGAYRWFLIRGKPLRNEHGLVSRWYLTRTDIED